MSNKRGGTDFERELMDRLRGINFAVVRVAGSGNDTPDLIAGRQRTTLAIDAKRHKRRPSQKQIRKWLEKTESQIADSTWVPTLAYKKTGAPWTSLELYSIPYVRLKGIENELVDYDVELRKEAAQARAEEEKHAAEH